MTNKLTELIEAAKAVAVPMYIPERTRDEIQGLRNAWITFHDLANPTTILELCALLEKAEAALKAQVEDKRDGPFFHEDEHPPESCLRKSEETLAAIKQWKEQ